MVPYIPMHTKILQNSLIHFSVYFVPAWYSLLIDLNCQNFWFMKKIIVMLLALLLLLPRLSTVKLGPTDVPEPKLYGKVLLLERNWVVVVDQGPTKRWRKTRRVKFECAPAYDIALMMKKITKKRNNWKKYVAKVMAKTISISFF